MDNSERLAVIILNWNGEKLLQQFFPSVYRHTQGNEVSLILADNGSTDGSCEWIKANYPDVEIIRFDKNYGFAEGYNKAIEATGFGYSLLLNSDVEVEEGWWQPILKTLRENPDIGALQPKIISWKDKNFFEYAGAAGGYLDKLGYPYCRGRLFDLVEKDEGQYDVKEPVDIAWASGAALAVKTDIYISAGGLDPMFFAHMEEIDLCWRIRRLGYRVVAISDSRVFHLGGGSLQQGDPKKTYLNFRNNLLLLHKNLPLDYGKRILFVRRLADTLAFIRFLLTFDIKNAKAIVRAHTDFRKMKKSYPINPEIKKVKLPGDDRLIIKDRFLLRKKK